MTTAKFGPLLDQVQACLSDAVFSICALFFGLVFELEVSPGNKGVHNSIWVENTASDKHAWTWIKNGPNFAVIIIKRLYLTKRNGIRLVITWRLCKYKTNMHQSTSTFKVRQICSDSFLIWLVFIWTYLLSHKLSSVSNAHSLVYRYSLFGCIYILYQHLRWKCRMIR